MKHKNYLQYKCKCGFEIEIFTDDLSTGKKDLNKAIKKHKTEISIDSLIKSHYPKAKFIGFVDGIGWYVRKGDLKRMVTAYEDVFTFHREEFEKFVAIYKPDNKYALLIKNYLKAYITDSEIRDIIETKEYSRLATNPKLTMKDFRDLNGWREVVPEYVKDYVFINAYM